MSRLTLTEARRVARRATQYGYQRPNDRSAHVRCPCCREQVGVELAAHLRAGGGDPFVRALRAAVVAHLRTPFEDEACAHSECTHGKEGQGG